MRLDSVQRKRSPNPNPRTRSTEPARSQHGASTEPARSQPKASASLDRLSAAAIRSGSRNEPGFALPGLRRICRKAAFSEPVQRRAANRFLPPSAPRKQRLSCSWFDSSQARKTVRWRCFLGLEFALVFAAKPELPRRPLRRAVAAPAMWRLRAGRWRGPAN